LVQQGAADDMPGGIGMLRMMLGVLLVALSSAGGAQAPSFDVASVKPNKSGETRVRFALPPGRFTASNASLRAGGMS